MKRTLFSVEQFTATNFASAEEKAKWANAMASWVKRGFPEKGWRKGLYKPLHTHMYGHIAEYDRLGFYNVWFADIYRRLNWLKYVALGGAFGIMGDPRYTWSDVERMFRAWVNSSGLIAEYEKLCADETERRERAMLTALLAKYPDAVAQKAQ